MRVLKVSVVSTAPSFTNNHRPPSDGNALKRNGTSTRQFFQYTEYRESTRQLYRHSVCTSEQSGNVGVSRAHVLPKRHHCVRHCDWQRFAALSRAGRFQTYRAACVHCWSRNCCCNYVGVTACCFADIDIPARLRTSESNVRHHHRHHRVVAVWVTRTAQLRRRVCRRGKDDAAVRFSW